MKNYHRWTDSELAYIRDNHVLLSDEELAANLSKIVNENITTAMIRRQRRKLVLKKQRGRRARFYEVVQEGEVVAQDET
jgi:hypothetical protein